MNKSNSECSSGCESGWTMYLDQSSNSTKNVDELNCQRNRGENNVDDSDLSMVSDASSAPPNFHQVEFFLSASQKTNKGKQKKKIEENRGKKLNSFLDDTASSPVFTFSHKNNMGVSGNQDSMENDSTATNFKVLHFYYLSL
ncbi:hypothetical protein LguiB_017386 [Lonicera macranthoides]